MAFYRIEQFGEDRADLRAGIIASTIYNMSRGQANKALGPMDFMPHIKKDIEKEEEKKRSNIPRLSEEKMQANSMAIKDRLMKYSGGK